jgi:tetratricopeptide (TPR) repeat protein
MVGRHEQFELINSKLDLALSGKGQVAGITGDAGIGKTRLVAEVIHQANQRHLVGYGSECQSYGVNSGYLVWQAIWQAFFELDHVLDLDSKIHAVKRKLIHIDPMLVPRLPLLGNILNLAIPDNDITAAMDAKLRKELLESMLVDCLRARAATTPMMMVLENCQWIDPLSQDLVEVISRAIQNLPVFLILVYRPPETPRRGQNGLNKLGYFTEITLKEFTSEEAERLVELKLAQLFDQQETLPTEALQHIIKQSEGNPFYIEELLNYLQDRNLAPGEQIDLPSSLHSLILTRIDQRTESQKTTLKLASTVGRMFFAHWLWGAFPQMATPEQVKGDLNELSMLDLTQRDTSEPELAYLFKHIVTQEVAYESLPFSTRAGLHDSLGDFIENAFSSSLDQYIDLLAYHYSLGKTDEKKREYLRKAAEQAEANYANQAAIDYYRRLIPLLQESEQIPVLLSLGQVLLLVGEGNQAAGVYEQALHLAEAIQDDRLLARSQVANGELFRRRGEYQSAATCYQEARRLYDSLSDEGGIGQVLHFSGTLAAQQGDYTKARQFYEESLAIRRKMNDKVNIANLLNNLGILARYQEDYQTAGQLYEESLSIRREVGNLIAISTSLTNLGILLRSQGDYARARSLLEEGLAINRKVGDKWGIGNSLSSLGEVALKQGDLMTARGYLRESLEISLTLGDRRGIAYLLEYFAGLAALQGKAERAIRLVGAAASLRVELGSPLSPAERIKLDELIAPAQAGLSELDQAREWGEGSRLDQAAAVHYALND